jgi:hypothetical protein
VCRVSSFWDGAAVWFDNASYLEIADVIRHWRSSGGALPHYFWGFPFAIAGISKLFSIPPVTAMVLISMLASLAVSILVHRLYGGWVAAAFAFLNYQWIVFWVEGGSEPLFVCLLYASFWTARSNRWNTAALLAALSTTVRPVGVLALLSFVAVLAKRRSFRQLATIKLIGLGIGVIYLIPLKVVAGNPFYNFIAYQEDWGGHRWPVTIPFGALIPSYSVGRNFVRWPVMAMFVVWVGVTLVAIAAIWLPRNREWAQLHPAEPLFACVYTFFFLSYNFIYISMFYPRFLIPVLPMYLFSLRDWIPRSRPLLWAGAITSALLASSAVVSFKKVFGFSLP